MICLNIKCFSIARNAMEGMLDYNIESALFPHAEKVINLI